MPTARRHRWRMSDRTRQGPEPRHPLRHPPRGRRVGEAGQCTGWGCGVLRLSHATCGLRTGNCGPTGTAYQSECHSSLFLGRTFLLSLSTAVSKAITVNRTIQLYCVLALVHCTLSLYLLTDYATVVCCGNQKLLARSRCCAHSRTKCKMKTKRPTVAQLLR